jgi:sulfofructose kinase
MGAQNTKIVDVVGVGINATDTVIRLPRFPTLDSKVEFISSAVLPGGQVASAMVACQRWGLQTRYAGRVGDDFAGELQRREFEKVGVEAHLKVIPGAQSQTSFILVDEPSGERTVLWNRSAEMTIRPEDLQREWVVNARALLVDGHDTAAAATAARWAREAGIPVTADLDNLYSGVEVLLENVDFLVCSKEFPARLTGEKDLLKALPAMQKRFRNRLAAATLGRDGVLAWDGEGFHYSPAYVIETVDTTGAGDIFHGAFVYAQLAGWNLDEQLAFSCAAAALNSTGLGARGGIAPLAEIRELVRSGKTHPPLLPSREFSA